MKRSRAVHCLSLLLLWPSVLQVCFSQPANRLVSSSQLRESRLHATTGPIICKHDSLIRHALSEIQPDTIRRSVQRLQDLGTRFALAPNRDSVWKWIELQFRSMGYTDVVIDSFLCHVTWRGVATTTWQKNVIATLQGMMPAGKVIVVGGHYDSSISLPEDPMSVAPGADDNASGTAAVLEIARALKKIGFKPQSTIKFITFAAEEIGLFGSLDYAGKAKATRMDIRLMINLDVISYSTEPLSGSSVRINYINRLIPETTESVAITTKFTVLSPRIGEGGSDEWSFSINGFPSVGFFEGRFSPYLHTTQNVVANHNMGYCAEVARAACAVAATFADEPLKVANLRVARNGALLMKWSPNKTIAVKHYRIYLGRESGIYDTTFTTSDTTLAVYDLEEQAQYFVGVTGVVNANNEGPLTEVSFGTLAENPFGPQQIVPAAFELFQNYPNPFNSGTHIRFDIPAARSVSLKVFDLLGREIAVLVDRELDAGRHAVRWDGKNAESGVYFYRLQAGTFTQTKRLLLLR